MKGIIINFDTNTKQGLILGNNGKKYTFSTDSWQERRISPQTQLKVDFEVNDKIAQDIYALTESSYRGKIKYLTQAIVILIASLTIANFFHKTTSSSPEPNTQEAPKRAQKEQSKNQYFNPYKLTRSFYNPKENNQEQFSASVSLSGNKILIGSTTTNGGGAAYLYDGSTGKLLQTFNDPKVNSKNHFGRAVSLYNTKVLIAASNDSNNRGAAYLYDGLTGKLLQTFNDPKAIGDNIFGVSVSLSGNKVLIGATGVPGRAGAAYLYDGLTGKLLRTFHAPKTTSSEEFGVSVSLSGNKVLIGALRILDGRLGAGYLYDGSTGKLLQTFYDPKTDREDVFGRSVSLSDNKVLIASPWDLTGPGTAYLYQLNPPIRKGTSQPPTEQK